MRKSYYKCNGIEVFDIINAFELNFYRGNVVKYICRCGRKHDNVVEDLEKAKTYIEYEIERIMKARNCAKKADLMTYRCILRKLTAKRAKRLTCINICKNDLEGLALWESM